MTNFCVAPVTKAQVDDLLAQLKTKGETVVEMEPDAWNIQGRVLFVKIEVNALYEESTQTLTVEVVHGPTGQIELELRKKLGLST